MALARLLIQVFEDGARHVLEGSDTLIGAGNELTPSLTSRSREADAQVAPSNKSSIISRSCVFLR